ncbi:hypothetical protein E2562_000217 [Oryza meyeriana var. granulata]|uniref:Uncharacterized protein n=1 Tax=Oryza meyeriana var. granulata TaxID=110450 RepID=A0A6G1CNW7_9ORYZ|nr:hypothetical protein E2562_000217 [Oryza meyeriana var. granulata]
MKLFSRWLFRRIVPEEFTSIVLGIIRVCSLSHMYNVNDIFGIQVQGSLSTHMHMIKKNVYFEVQLGLQARFAAP